MGKKSRNFYTPPVFSASAGGWPRRNFVNVFDADKTRMIGLSMVKILWQYVKPFSSDTGTWRTDRRTDGRTDGQNCYINIARDKNGRMNDIVIQKNTDSTITPQKWMLGSVVGYSILEVWTVDWDRATTHHQHTVVVAETKLVSWYATDCRLIGRSSHLLPILAYLVASRPPRRSLPPPRLPPSHSCLATVLQACNAMSWHDTTSPSTLWASTSRHRNRHADRDAGGETGR